MNASINNAAQISNREVFQQREAAALRSISGVDKLLSTSGEDHLKAELEYPEAVFALQILSNPFVPDREMGAIRMEAYSSILNGESIAAVHYRYDR